MHPLKYKNKIFFILLIFSFLLKGCGGQDSTADRIYRDAFLGEIEGIDCPEIRLIKELDSFEKIDEDDDTLYIVKFNNVKYDCYIQYEELSDANGSFVDNFFETENNIKTVFTSKINIDISFLLSMGDKLQNENTESFSYVIALTDSSENIIVKKQFDSFFILGTEYEKLILKDKTINVVLPNINLSSEKYRLFLGFIKN